MKRRQFHRCALALGSLGLAGAPAAWAQTPPPAWPSRPVRFIVPFPPGSGPDVAVRLISDKLAAAWGQGVVVDNRPGASGLVGIQNLLNAPADQHTLLFAQGSAIAIVPRTVRNVTFDPRRDLVPVGAVAVAPMALAVRSDDPGIRSLDDFIREARANPGRLEVGNPGRATIPHLAAEVLALQADARILPVPFQGTPAAVAALIGGSIRAIVDGYSVLQPQAASGRLRILAILADQVYSGLENYPLSTKTLPDTAAMGWFGVYAKTGTDPAVVQRVNTDLNAALATPDVVTRLRDLGTYPRPGSPAALDAFTQAEIRFWAEKLDKLGIKPE